MNTCYSNRIKYKSNNQESRTMVGLDENLININNSKTSNIFQIKNDYMNQEKINEAIVYLNTYIKGTVFLKKYVLPIIIMLKLIQHKIFILMNQKTLHQIVIQCVHILIHIIKPMMDAMIQLDMLVI